MSDSGDRATARAYQGKKKQEHQTTYMLGRKRYQLQ